jgi:hypothetical protein
MRPTEDGHRRILVRHVDEQPVLRGWLRARQHGIDHVERGEIDDPGLRARLLADRLVLPNDVLARHDHHEFGAAIGVAHPLSVGHLRVFDPERRRLADLPADELVEIARPRGNFLEAEQRDLADGVGDRERDTPGPDAHALEHESQGGADALRVRDVAGVERGQHQPGRKRLERVRRDRQRGIAAGNRGGGHAMSRNLDRNGRRRRREKGPIQQR